MDPTQSAQWMWKAGFVFCEREIMVDNDIGYPPLTQDIS